MERCLIIKSKNEVEYGVRLMLDRYWFVREKIKNTNAYTDEETKERLELIKERQLLENYLHMMGIQSFEVKSDWLVFKIE